MVGQISESSIGGIAAPPRPLQTVNPLVAGTEWDFRKIERVYGAIEEIAVEELKLDNCYPNQLEIITSEQMVDAYTSIGMPIFYKHWSFGKHFAAQWDQYRRGYMGLAYEIVINSNPCIVYLMEENTMTMQALTISHAGFGHNWFFANNYMFRDWTDASAIVDYLVFARNYIQKCEVREGQQAVETFLDSCHALMSYGVNRYKRPAKLSATKEKLRQDAREAYDQSQLTELAQFFHSLQEKQETEKTERFPREPEENILYFCEKYAPDLPEWKREIIRIVRKVSQYFYPQGQTKVMNEGCATYTHYRIMNRLHDKGLMTDGAMLEFLNSHTNVVTQPAFDDNRYSGINPYALGFAMMRDIERICKEPTAEDRKQFDFAGCNDEMTILKDAWANYRDESFVRQFLSKQLIREMDLFQLKDTRTDPNYLVTAIHNERGYDAIRETLANQYERHFYVPQIEVAKVDPQSRMLYLEYTPYLNRSLANAGKMLKHVQALWGHPVSIHDDKNNHIA
jgi:stage V sporulation protein R